MSTHTSNPFPYLPGQGHQNMSPRGLLSQYFKKSQRTPYSYENVAKEIRERLFFSFKGFMVVCFSFVVDLREESHACGVYGNP
jgi:hypothetical protein